MLRREPAVHRFDDPVHGTVHLPDRDDTSLHADLDLAVGELVTLDAGSLADGRPVVLHLVVRR